MKQVVADPREPLSALFADLGSSPDGLSEREAARRLITYGPHGLIRRGGRRWPTELARQFTHPLALLLAVAAVLAAVTGTPNSAAAIGAVIVLNAVFAFVQAMHAEQAVEALAAFLPEKARLMRDSLRAVGVLSNRPLLAGIGASLLFAALLIYLPPLHAAFGTAALSPTQPATLAPFPFIVWGADELRRHRRRRAQEGTP